MIAINVFLIFLIIWCLGDLICKRLDMQNFILKDIADSLEQLTDKSK